MTSPRLLDTGPSPRGFHRLERFWQCPLKYYWRDVAGGQLPPGDALVRGSIGHVGLAHHFARIGLARRGENVEQVYPIDTAMAMVADKFGTTGRAMLSTAAAAVRRHCTTYVNDEDRWEVIGVEKLFDSAFTYNGESARYTARADLIVRERLGREKVWVVDHKFVGRVEDKVFTRYALSGQFLGLHHLARERYGQEFGGILLNVVGCNDGQLVRREPEPAPWALARYPRLVVETEKRISELEGLGTVDAWPMAVSEQICVGPYGKCEWFATCRWGPRL